MTKQIFVLLLFVVLVSCQIQQTVFFYQSTTCEGSNSRKLTRATYCRGGEIGYFGATCNQTHSIIHDHCNTRECLPSDCTSRVYKHGVCYKWGNSDSQLFLRCDL
jgi:hypothetical protein